MGYTPGYTSQDPKVGRYTPGYPSQDPKERRRNLCAECVPLSC